MPPEIKLENPHDPKQRYDVFPPPKHLAKCYELFGIHVRLLWSASHVPYNNDKHDLKRLPKRDRRPLIKNLAYFKRADGKIYAKKNNTRAMHRLCRREFCRVDG